MKPEVWPVASRLILSVILTPILLALLGAAEASDGPVTIFAMGNANGTPPTYPAIHIEATLSPVQAGGNAELRIAVKDAIAASWQFNLNGRSYKVTNDAGLAAVRTVYLPVPANSGASFSVSGSIQRAGSDTRYSVHGAIPVVGTLAQNQSGVSNWQSPDTGNVSLHNSTTVELGSTQQQSGSMNVQSAAVGDVRGKAIAPTAEEERFPQWFKSESSGTNLSRAAPSASDLNSRIGIDNYASQSGGQGRADERLDARALADKPQQGTRAVESTSSAPFSTAAGEDSARGTVAAPTPTDPASPRPLAAPPALDKQTIHGNSVVAPSGSTARATPVLVTHPAPTPSEPSVKRLDNYRAVVAANGKIAIPGPPGELRVWIGSSRLTPVFEDEMKVGQSTIPALSDTAKVTPFAPGIDVDPKESLCEKIDPSGSQVRFQLKPNSKGTFKVGADIALYASNDCSGAAIPKTAATIQVEVVADTAKEVEGHLGEILSETWRGILAFWRELIVALLALLLFLVRRRLSRWFGLSPNFWRSAMSR